MVPSTNAAGPSFSNMTPGLFLKSEHGVRVFDSFPRKRISVIEERTTGFHGRRDTIQYAI